MSWTRVDRAESPDEADPTRVAPPELVDPERVARLRAAWLRRTLPVDAEAIAAAIIAAARPSR